MKKMKHDHRPTQCLKVIVFSLLILMPFLIFIPNGLYYGFNDSATVSSTITEEMATAWSSIWTNNLFAWVSNTAIYTVVNNTTTLIEITSDSCVAQYLTYIFLLTVIYVIVDIIIGTFTMLTHIFNKEAK